MVTIHTLECPNLEKIDIERRIPARWETDTENLSVTFTIECIFQDKKGILMRLSQLFYQFGLNIMSFHTETLEHNMIKDVFTLTTDQDDYYIFERLENRMKFEIPEIQEITLLEMH